MPFDAKSYGVQIGTKVYVSTPVPGSFGQAGYIPTILDAEAAA